MGPLCYRRHRFSPEIIHHAIWLYLRFTLSYRDVEELLAERGLDISYETVRRWVLKFGPAIARRLRQRRPRPSDRWHLDEMVVRIAGKRTYLWRAVDDEGEVLDMLVQRRRDGRAALRLMRKLLKKQGFVPKLLVTDKLRSYASAFRRLRLTCRHEQGLRKNDRAENSHQAVRRRSGSFLTRRWRKPDSNPRSPPWGKNANMRSRAKIGKSRPAPTAARRGLVRPVHQLPGRSAILRNLTAG
jgi:putative transposase